MLLRSVVCSRAALVIGDDAEQFLVLWVFWLAASEIGKSEVLLSWYQNGNQTKSVMSLELSDFTSNQRIRLKEYGLKCPLDERSDESVLNDQGTYGVKYEEMKHISANLECIVFKI